MADTPHQLTWESLSSQPLAQEEDPKFYLQEELQFNMICGN